MPFAAEGPPAEGLPAEGPPYYILDIDGLLIPCCSKDGGKAISLKKMSKRK